VKKRIVLIVGVALLLPWAAEAKTLYVNAATGNDSTSYAANGSSAPWATIGRAAWGSTNKAAPNAGQAAQPGDIVIVAAGTYDQAASGGTRYDPLYNPANSGTAGNQITFRADGRVTLRSTTYPGPVIGAYSRSYITWEGFYIDEDFTLSREDTGPVTVVSGNNNVIQGIEINGASVNFSPDTENHNGIRVEGANHTQLRNNLIYGIRTAGSLHHNHAAIMLYDTNDSIIENNEIHTSGSGIFVKGIHSGRTQTRNIIRYNVLHSLPKAVILLGSDSSRIYQNVFRNNYAGVSIYAIGTGTTDHSINDVIANNTFYDNENAIYFEGVNSWQNLRVFNNIIANSGLYAIVAEDGFTSNPGSSQFEHNLYFANAAHAGFSSNYTLATWRSTFGKDAVTPQSISADPRFMNPGGNDFRLGAGSAAVSLGVDILDVNRNGSASDLIVAGAYLTGTEVIGRTSGPMTPPVPAPAAPTNVRVLR
jgi:hypothetical protein